MSKLLRNRRISSGPLFSDNAHNLETPHPTPEPVTSVSEFGDSSEGSAEGFSISPVPVAEDFTASLDSEMSGLPRKSLDDGARVPLNAPVSKNVIYSEFHF